MSTEKHDHWALLREARNLVGFCPTTQEGIDSVCKVRDRIDAALAARDTQAVDSDESNAIWRAYANREMSEDEAKAKLAALEIK